MRRVLTAVACCGALFFGAAPAVAADSGTIVGQVVNATKGEPQANAKVTLTAAAPDGSNEKTTTVRTDSDGRYRFDDLATGEDWFYVIDALYQGGFFPSRALSLPDDTTRAPVIRTTLRVWETTTDPAAVLITRDDMFAVLGEQGIRIIESTTVVNQTDQAYIGRGMGITGEKGGPTLGFSLPVDCNSTSISIVDSDLDLPHIDCTDFGFAVTTAIPPGEARTTFSYDIPGETGTFNLSRTALYDIAEMSVFAADPLTLESNRLVERGEVTLADKTYRRWSTRGPVDPGDRVQVLAIAQAGLTPGLLIGAAATALVVAGLLTFAFRRRRRSPAATEPEKSEVMAHEELIRAIAALDIAYEKGELQEADWSARRSDLKARIGAGENR
jgi:5-hydroxyisourate hydrolase-like protein (transthyretin family)